MKKKKSTIADLPNDIRRALLLDAMAKSIPYTKNAYVQEIIKQAQNGEFHDFKNKRYVCGKVELVNMLYEANEPALLPIRDAVINGEYDESPDEEDKANMKKDWLENVGTEDNYNRMFGK